MERSRPLIKGGQRDGRGREEQGGKNRWKRGCIYTGTVRGNERENRAGGKEKREKPARG